MRRRIWLLTVGSIAVLCTCLSWHFARQVKELAGYVGFYNEESVISGEQLKEFYHKKQEEKVTLPQSAAWKMAAGEVKNTTAGRGKNCQICYVQGNPQVIFGNELSGGNYPSSYDKNGCLISLGLAEALYQSSSPLGRTIEIEGKEKIIRGILKTQDKLAVVQEEGGEFTNQAFFYEDSQTPLSYSEQLYYEMWGSSPETVVEGNLYTAVAGVWKTVPVCIFFLTIVHGIGKRLKKRKIFGCKTVMLGMDLGILAAWLFLGFHFSPDYLPSMWSDLDFWRNLWREKWETYQVLKNSVLSLQDRQMLKSLGNCIAACQGGIFFYLCCFLKFPEKIKNPIDE